MHALRQQLCNLPRQPPGQRGAAQGYAAPLQCTTLSNRVAIDRASSLCNKKMTQTSIRESRMTQYARERRCEKSGE